MSSLFFNDYYMKARSLIVFILSLIVYAVCLDPNASLWDCPEYILVAWGLEVGHPPGNPTWQLMANVAAHLGWSPQHAALLINLTSALAMAIASALLCEITYIFLRYSIFRRVRYKTRLASFCAVCGALCYAWCDSAIFSAVEAEVYALSAMVTALTVWLALRWAVARVGGNRRKAQRIAILTWYVMGLSMGVHELNLLALPAMGLIYWYGWRSSRRDAGKTAALARLATTTLWGVLFFLAGCSTYLILPMRAAANPPVNQGNPSSWEAFKAYYGREQYGSKPLLYGRTPYSKPLLKEEIDTNGNYTYPAYYLKENPKGKKELVYPEALNMWFPRMTSGDELDIASYEAWSGMEKANMTRVHPEYAVDSLGNQVFKMDSSTGRRAAGEESYRPTYLQQLRYFFGYQVGYMYFRYLLWNFSGRQNNIPSTGEIDHGNFITGIPAIDDLMLGAQSQLPGELKDENRGYNRYFMIPFLLGVIGACGLVAYGKRGRRVIYIVGLLFLFTGVGIVVYLNQDPGEPRERDYSFLGSYMAFAIWIACAMAEAVKAAKRFARPKASGAPRWRKSVAALISAVCAAVPLLILSQTYDDHDRSGRDVAGAIASNILNSLERNAIVFVDGDNIIFPLWYGQEVLGLRPDVTVVEVGYLPTEWYRRQLAGYGLPGLDTDGSRTVAAVVADIIEANSTSGSPRPVYWHSAIATRPYFQRFEEESEPTLFTYKLREEGMDSLEAAEAAIAEGLRALPLLKTGGTENPRFYAEPYVAEELIRMRRGVYRLANNIRQAGDTLRADSVVRVAQRLWPFSKVPPSSSESQPLSLKERRRREYRLYYDAMPPSRRGAISKESLDRMK